MARNEAQEGEQWTDEDNARFNALSFVVAELAIIEDRSPANGTAREWLVLYRKWQRSIGAIE